jgi:hypothetical protein
MGSGGRTLRYASVDDIFLIVHAHVDPDPTEWNLLMEQSRASVRRYRRCLVSSADSKLTAKQRNDLGEFVKTNECNVAVLVDSALTRGMVTALGWVTGRYRAFNSDDVEGAVAYLESEVAPAKIREEIRSMRKEMLRGTASAG